MPVGDDIAGGTTNITFEKVYENTTTSGTPVYVYAPVGWNVNGGKGVLGLDPQVDPNPADDLKPCADRDQSEYVITQPQITQLGDALTNQIVRVDEAQFGPIGLADASDPDSDALVVLAYNAFDDFFYFCDETSYTAGYFAPNFIHDLGMNVIVVDVLDWANSIGAAGGFSIEGIIAHELEHLLMEYSDTTELSWVDEGLADLAAFFNNYYGDENSALAAHSAYHQVYHRETSLTRWGGGLENYGAAYSWFVYLWEQAGGNGGGSLTPDGDYDATAGDLLIKLIFQNQADSWAGIESAIAAWEAQTGQRPAGHQDALPGLGRRDVRRQDRHALRLHEPRVRHRGDVLGLHGRPREQLHLGRPRRLQGRDARAEVAQGQRPRAGRAALRRLLRDVHERRLVDPGRLHGRSRAWTSSRSSAPPTGTPATRTAPSVS